MHRSKGDHIFLAYKLLSNDQVKNDLDVSKKAKYIYLYMY